MQYRENPSRGKPGTFDFLGFTHYIGKKLSGEVIVKRKTKRNRQVTQLKRIKHELRKRLHDKPWETGRWLRRVIQGHINYYGVPYNVGLYILIRNNAFTPNTRGRSRMR